jgi:threonine/homoserine/homoserine lactone efflux protein
MTMVDFGVLPGFVAVILLFLIPPGPDMAYMLAVGLQGGRRPALKAILGIGTGMSVYAGAVVVGVGKFAQSNPLLLEAIKMLGAAYLLWLAYVTVRRASRTSGAVGGTATDRWYLRGALVSVANPKIVLFFLAVLPGFTGKAQNVVLQMGMLGAVNVFIEVVLYGSIGLFAGGFRARFSGARTASTVLNYVAGIVYLSLAVAIFSQAFLG